MSSPFADGKCLSRCHLLRKPLPSPSEGISIASSATVSRPSSFRRRPGTRYHCPDTLRSSASLSSPSDRPKTKTERRRPRREPSSNAPSLPPSPPSRPPPPSPRRPGPGHLAWNGTPARHTFQSALWESTALAALAPRPLHLWRRRGDFVSGDLTCGPSVWRYKVWIR